MAGVKALRFQVKKLQRMANYFSLLQPKTRICLLVTEMLCNHVRLKLNDSVTKLSTGISVFCVILLPVISKHSGFL